MDVLSPGYREYTETPRSSLWACWAIARTSMSLVFRRKLFWILFAFASLAFLFLFAIIYFRATLIVRMPRASEFVDRLFEGAAGNGNTYRGFMMGQEAITIIILAFAGSILVGRDHQTGGMIFFLSRRISLFHYMVGKLLAIGMIVLLVTTLPAIVLYIQFGYMSDHPMDYFQENWRIVVSILTFGTIIASVLSLVLLATGSWMQKTVPLVLSWIGIFMILPAIAMFLWRIYGLKNCMLMNLAFDLRLVSHWCFGSVPRHHRGMPPDAMEMLPGAIAVLIVVCIVALLLTIPKIRAVKVVQ